MKKIFVAFLLLLLMQSCNKNDTGVCSSGPVAHKSLASEYGCTDNFYKYHVNINSNTFVIIKNQADYNSTVIAGCQSIIDFTTYDLVIGRQQLFTGCRQILYALSKNCQDNTLTIDVTILRDFTLFVPVVTYNCLVPKLASHEKAIVNVTVKD